MHLAWSYNTVWLRPDCYIHVRYRILDTHSLFSQSKNSRNRNKRCHWWTQWRNPQKINSWIKSLKLKICCNTKTTGQINEKILWWSTLTFVTLRTTGTCAGNPIKKFLLWHFEEFYTPLFRLPDMILNYSGWIILTMTRLMRDWWDIKWASQWHSGYYSRFIKNSLDGRWRQFIKLLTLGES